MHIRLSQTITSDVLSKTGRYWYGNETWLFSSSSHSSIDLLAKAKGSASLLYFSCFRNCSSSSYVWKGLIVKRSFAKGNWYPLPIHNNKYVFVCNKLYSSSLFTRPDRRIISHLGQLSLPSLRGRKIEYRPVWLGLRWSVLTCVGWQVTLCDPVMASDTP